MKKHLITAIVVALVVVLIIPTGCPKPAEFEVTTLDISPAEVVSGDPTDVTVEVENIGGSEGTYTVTLELDGIKLETKEDTLAAGAKETVTWQITEDIGTHQVGVDGLSRSFKVLKPAEFEVVNLNIAPNPVKVGEQVTGTATIENVGEATGTYEANLLVDGEVIWTTEVTLAGGTTETVSYSEYTDYPGNYNIEIDGQEVILRVVQPVRLETGTILEKEMSGKGKLEIENELDLDVVVVLSLAKEPGIPLLAFYVQSHDSYLARGIHRGTYVLYFAVGEDWDEDSRKFTMKAAYYRHKGETEWEETTRKRQTWYFTLDPLIVEVYHELVSEGEFPSLG